MSDVIRLLPDSVANQIAAGEVVQRPASAVKELLENAIDAGATQIKLIVKDAGRTLIQVTDNGKGMSETDARMCFERHATSKIKEAADLFSIQTMGFRGEALASIAAIARVELKTRTPESALGSEIIIEGSLTETQQPCQCPQGTSIAIKNLFYNTPARRNFLKSDPVEKSHIFQELVRVALANPQVGFIYYQNGQLTHQLESSNLKQRIISLFGSQYNQRLVPVEENTEIVALDGFVIKPEFARKKRGEQFFFVNNRFIRSAYLNHAVDQAYRELIPEDLFPSFFIFMETDPRQIDVNVHPTKTEIKFQDEKFIYQILLAAVKRSLGKYNISPTLDFERETAFDHMELDKNQPVKPPVIHVNPGFNPFENQRGRSSAGGSLTSRINPSQWEKLFPSHDSMPVQAGTQQQQQTIISANWEDNHEEEPSSQKFLHLQNRYILATVKSGLMVIDQQRAHERILYEKYLRRLEQSKSASQQLLFPETLVLIEYDADLLREIMVQVKAFGFEISENGRNTFVITGQPADLPDNESLQDVLEGVLEHYKKNKIQSQLDIQTNVARSLARRLCVKQGTSLSEQEMMTITNSLFACQMPYQSPAGMPTVKIIDASEIEEKFR
ncbi:MAG: DNA mismatch repair endonuclease MutL [Bacteroidales bacterium]